MKFSSLAVSLAGVLALAGCSTLVPKNTAVAPAIPAQWPAEAVQGQVADAAAVGWRDFFTDARLQQVIEQSLQNNRDLRVAVLNVERARGQYRVQRADRVPGVAVTGQMDRRGTDAGVSEQFTAGVGVAEFELDLFGRVRNLSEAALQQYFAVAANRRNAQLSLVAESATAWLTYGADAQRLKIAEATLKTYEDSLRLAEARHERGGSSALELTQTRTLVETARTDAARLRGQLAQDRNALALLAGGQLDPALLPDGIEPQLLALAPPPAGLPSDVLLQRPDIMAAEHQLKLRNELRVHSLRLGIHFSSEDVKNPCHFECPHRLSDKLLKSSCDALQRSVARWRILHFPLSESTLNFRIFSLQPTGLFVK